MLKMRIKNPNLYYVGPVEFKIEMQEHFCSEYYDVEIYMPHPEEDLSKEISKRASKKKQHLEKYSQGKFVLKHSNSWINFL